MSAVALPARRTRTSGSHRAHLMHVRARVVDLREQGVPFRLIATNLSITEREAWEAYRGYVAEVAERAAGTEFIARHTRIAQMEWLMTRLAVIVSQPVTNPVEMKRIGLKPMDWLVAAGSYGRAVGQVAALEGLVSKGAARAEPVVPDAPGVDAEVPAAAEAPDPALVAYALEFALGEDPDLYYEFRERAMRRAFGDPEAQRVRVESVEPGPGGSAPGADGGEGAAGPSPGHDPDPGLCPPG